MDSPNLGRPISSREGKLDYGDFRNRSWVSYCQRDLSKYPSVSEYIRLDPEPILVLKKPLTLGLNLTS